MQKLWLMNEIITSIFTATLVLGSVQVIALLKAQKSNKQANIVMAMFLIVAMLVALDCYLVSSGYYRKFPFFIKAFTPLNLFFGILPYCYSRSLTNTPAKLCSKCLWHFVPIIGLYFLYSPVYFLSAEERIQHIAQNQDFLLRKIAVLYILISNTIYMVRGYLNTLAFQKTVKNSGEKLELMKAYWLKQWFHVLIFIHVSVTLSTFLFANQGFQVAYLSLFVGIFVIIVFSGYVAIRQIDPLIAMAENTGSFKAENLMGKKIPEKTKEKAFLALEKILIEEKSYLNSDLNLDSLAKKMGQPSYVVSYALNKKYKMNFFELINSLRVKEASTRLKQKEYKHLTIIAIAEDVGFNSKSTFNSAFKKYMGVTPSQFRSSES